MVNAEGHGNNANDQLLFAYGTLRRTLVPTKLKAIVNHFVDYAEGYVYGKLYEVNGYPGLIDSDNQNEKVFGDVFTLINAEKILYKLDAYEECLPHSPYPHEYKREKRLVNLTGGKQVEAWVYLYNYDVARLFQIKSGDYVKFTKFHR